MDLINWIIGPQLIGIVILIIGWIMVKYPPKKINCLYGYRTEASMKNQQTWDEANRFSAHLMIKIGWILILVGLLFSLILNAAVLQPNIQNVLRPVLLLISSTAAAVALIAITQRHLEKTFPENYK